MSIRLITEKDIPGLTVLARRGLEFEYLDEALVWEKTVGATGNDGELGLLYEDGGRVTAFAQGVIGGELDGKAKGCVRMFCVDRAYRREGHGDALFNELEGRLRERGAQVVTVMDSPANYLTPGVDFRYTETYCFLLSRGYEVFRENHSMRCELRVDAWPDLDEDVRRLADSMWQGLPAPEQETLRVHGQDARATAEVRRACAEDWPGIKRFLEQEWAGWIPEVRAALENDPPGVYIAVKDGAVVAFAAYQGNNRSLPWFGPMGTSGAVRGRGAGAVLLRLCLRDLARQGWDHAIIPWVGPVAFYARFCGAWIDRCFWAYKKGL